MRFTKSAKIYFVLILILAVFSAINVFLPFGTVVGQFELPASKPVVAIATFFIMLVLYGGLGYVGLLLSKKLGFADIWDDKVDNRQRFLIPAAIGVCIGIFFVFTDMIFAKYHALGSLPHPPFPTSIVASITAGIGEEVMFRLFFISFWVWLISFVVLRKRGLNYVFWIVAIFSALGFAFGHIPSVMVLFGLESISEIPLPLMVEIILLNGVLSLFAAGNFKKYGFLAAVGIHFWADIVWHVIYGFYY